MSGGPSAATAASPSTLNTHSNEKAALSCCSSRVKEVYTLFIRRLTLIDTAEESEQWASRASAQWGEGKPLTISVSCNAQHRGRTQPQRIEFATSSLHPGWSGIVWGDPTGINVPLREDAMVMLEVSPTSKHGSGQVVGLGILNAQSMLAEERQYAKLCVHVLPTHAPIDSSTVHAVIDVELHSSLLDEPPEENFTPLELNYGSVRVSTVDFYYPSFLLTAAGQYIVSNVVCAMNMTESSSLAMQLVPLREVANYITAEPAQVITVLPQQRVYFSGTWVLSQKACMRTLEMQLFVNGSQKPSAPIIIKAHNTIPQPTATDLPYQYWVNTTCITNRQMLPSQELPLIRAILPVYRFLNCTPTYQTEGMIVAYDKDKGEQVLVHASGVPVAMRKPSYRYGNNSGGAGCAIGYAGSTGAADFSSGFDDAIFSNTTMAAAAAAATVEDLFSATFLLNPNASFVVRDRSTSTALPSRGPLLDLSQRSCLCTIVLGTIRGFPMVYELSTGVSPSFQVSVTLLDQKGWQVVHGETRPSYQSASGSLRWVERLVLRKWPGAESTQFLRLNLTEVRPRDGDETPIGAALISLASMQRTYAHTPLNVAFYVYETYSLYDQLNSPSLLMKDACVIFSELR